MSRPKVLVQTNMIPESVLNLLRKKCDVIVNDERIPTKAKVLSLVSGVDAIYCAYFRIDKEVIEAAGPQLKVVSTMSSGINHIDVDELKKRGIRLGNTAKVVDDPVADIAVLLTLAASRRIHEGRLKIERSQWEIGFDWMAGQDIRGSTVGIVGLGGIGQSIVKRLIPFGVSKFLYTGRSEKKEGKELNAHFVPLDTLARESDFVVLSCPLTEETKGMFDERLFSLMKKTAVFVNIARGELVDQSALVKALKNRDIFAAGLDVMYPEPLPPDHELLTLPNCVLMPHIGSATLNTRLSMAEVAAQNIIRALDGEEMISPVF